MSQRPLVPLDEAPALDRFTFQLGTKWTLEIKRSSREVELNFSTSAGLAATARVPFVEAMESFDARPTPRGFSLRATLAKLPGCPARRWSLRLIPVAGEMLLQILEVSSIAAGAWSLEFTGPTSHVQKQVSFFSAATNETKFRFGAFTQHGQISDFKDWFLVERDGVCSGLLTLRPGTWTHPAKTLAHAKGNGDSLRLEFPHSAPRVRRSFLLVQAQAAEALAFKKTGIAGFEPAEGYADWPSRQVARFGFARRERMDAYANAVKSMTLSRPSRFAFGGADALARAQRRAQCEPDLLQNPFWAGDFAAAKAWMFTSLRKMDTALRNNGYLHPLGNPVAGRTLGPAAGLFHLLDVLGQLTDAERTDAATLIATLAELLFRRDFYPHDFATEPPEFPYTDASIYRGMLNQNFNTDRYVFVGLAGCVLPTHPHAARWRKHSVTQFESQMRAFVYPGGCWEESHTYANHVKITLLPLVLALRHMEGDAVDLMANENFVATCRFFIPLLSPPDPALSGLRRIPAIGDHNYAKHDDFSCTMGWLATLCPDRRDEFLWAWRSQGSTVGESHSIHATTFSPLLLPEANSPTPASPPMPSMKTLPGYGAFARRSFGTPSESLLVVRCGPAWGHYHNDQGSFWWWVGQRLICCDAGLGSGKLKFVTQGHNVPGYVGKEPRQWLDRHPYEIDRCETSADGETTIRCQIPTIHWMDAFEATDQLPPHQRPIITRTIQWARDNELTIADAFVRAPNSLATFSLHSLSRGVKRTGPKEVEFDLNPGVLRLQLPLAPSEVAFHHDDSTTGVTCRYPEGTLVHRLSVLQ